MRFTKQQVGLAAVVLLAPGGFVLGATLIANRYRKRLAAKAGEPPEPPIVS